jgi:hypothetical protein
MRLFLTAVLALMLAGASKPDPRSVVRVDLEDALQFPGGAVHPSPSGPIVLYARVPPGWIASGALTGKAKGLLLAKLYGGPDWEQGNSDGSKFVVQSFRSRVLTSAELAAPIWKDAKSQNTWFYEAKPDGALEKRELGFAPTPPPAPPLALKTTDSYGTFTRGPSLYPPERLIAWLDNQVKDGRPRLVRLPVILGLGQVNFSIRGANVGTGAYVLELDCNDSALGVGLAERARQACKGQQTCALWLEGRWRGKKDDRFTFDVTRVHAPILPDGLAGADYVQVEENAKP